MKRKRNQDLRVLLYRAIIFSNLAVIWTTLTITVSACKSRPCLSPLHAVRDLLFLFERIAADVAGEVWG
jgi:hypothetical protein